MNGQYVFAVRVHLESAQDEISLEPGSAEPRVIVFREAPEPGSEGWLFFRNTLWRGEVSDQDHARQLAEEWLDLPIVSVDFRELQVDEVYFEAMKSEIADDLETFKAENVSEVLSKYLGSSIRVTEDI
ncbi:LWR-salt protein [Natronolimnobius sp. AArcel1]|uniref:LWR-salt protein n=1 Tax=Natronolimnobius sp. AArcel1 TaxID=1679093 RepID=UPI0013EE11BC|nr:LWR-salt protein [Natronolimnobius sp. AArcel1]NGM68038.1 LWR-salt protein [Natronolimnobius sp. AArcel1]